MLKNMTEILVEQKLEDVWKNQDCCKCEQCKEDTMALALNHLPPHYISTDSGELYAKADMMSAQSDFDIMREVVKAMNIVSKHPRHV